MSTSMVPEFLSEPERYELDERTLLGELDRREFFRITGAGIVVAMLATDQADAQGPGRRRFGGGRQSQPREIGAWLHIGEDSAVTVFTGKVEIGQNIRTSLTQVVAEELRTPVERIHLVMADTERTPFDGGTAGSQTTPVMASQLRRVAAAARELLLDLAAEQGKVERGKLTAAGGKIVDAEAHKEFDFGQLTRGKKLMKVVGPEPATTPPSQWKIAGTPVPKIDGRDFVTGTHKFASDVKRPGMLFGKVLRPESFKARLISVQTNKAEALPGVTLVRDGDFIGVAAPSSWAAEKALAAIHAEWQSVPQPSSDELFDYLKAHPSAGRGGFGGPSRPRRGSVEDGLKLADVKLRDTYTVAYIAHAPLEPRAAVAEWSDGKLTVWTGTQRPFGVRHELAEVFKLRDDQVHVIVPDMGAGYGGKHTGEVAIDAARLARAVGKPVKLVWTREEEFTWAYFRPAGVIDISAGVKKDGTLTAWQAHNYNSGGSSLATPYDVANEHSEFHGAESPLRQGSYRALAATANTFAREMTMDTLARAVSMDALAFRLKNLKDARLSAVLEAAARQFGWGKARPAAGHGVGIAAGTEKHSYVATCAEVAVDAAAGRVKIVRAVTAFECGAVVNPDNLKNQIEGAVMMGLGGALTEAIRFAGGKILNPRFSAYKVARFADLPVLESVILDRKDLPSVGAGETPIVAIAPAVGNAIFDATGLRLRSLPMLPDGLKISALGIRH